MQLRVVSTGRKCFGLLLLVRTYIVLLLFCALSTYRYPGEGSPGGGLRSLSSFELQVTSQVT